MSFQKRLLKAASGHPALNMRILNGTRYVCSIDEFLFDVVFNSINNKSTFWLKRSIAIISCKIMHGSHLANKRCWLLYSRAHHVWVTNVLAYCFWVRRDKNIHVAVQSYSPVLRSEACRSTGLSRRTILLWQWTTVLGHWCFGVVWVLMAQVNPSKTEANLNVHVIQRFSRRIFRMQHKNWEWDTTGCSNRTMIQKQTDKPVQK